MHTRRERTEAEGGLAALGGAQDEHAHIGWRGESVRGAGWVPWVRFSVELRRLSLTGDGMELERPRESDSASRRDLRRWLRGLDDAEMPATFCEDMLRMGGTPGGSARHVSEAFAPQCA